MKKRMILMLVAMGIFIATIAAVKTRQIQAAIKKGAYTPPPEAVTTVTAKKEQWSATWSSVGTVAAVHGVTVSADLPGLVDKISFESGQSVEAGAELVRLDTRQERAQLEAAEAARVLAELNVNRTRGLVDKGVISQADLDRLVAEQKQAEARVGEIQATIARKTIRAPFAGVLGIRQVNLGQYLQGGAAIVSLQSIRPVYVNFAIPQQETGAIRVGSPIQVHAEGAALKAEGRVTALDSVVNEATRNVQIQATFDNADGKLRPGMFVKAETGLGVGPTVITVPTSAILYAPYGDSVFVVENVKGPKGDTYLGVRQQFVKVGASRGDQIAVLTGLKDGEQVVSSGVFKLRNGAAVKVNNTVQPGNNPAPRPEDS